MPAVSTVCSGVPVGGVFQGAGKVVGVDINPAQSYLLELKRAAIMRYTYLFELSV